VLDRGAAVRVTDTEAGPALVVLGSAAALGEEVAVASQTSLDAKVRVSATQTPARASTSAALRAKQVLNRQNRIGAADNGGVALNGQYHDQVLWSILAEDWRLQRLAAATVIVH